MTPTTNTEHRHLRPRPRGEDLLPGPPAWTRKAVCAKIGRPEDWSPDPADREAVEAALEVCGRCPVRGRCLDDALALPRLAQGTIRGGMTEHQRRNEHRRRNRARATAAGRDKVNALEAVRMVRALSADGRSRVEMAFAADVSLATIGKLRDGATVIEANIAERIRAAYRILSEKPVTETAHTSRNRNHAAACGWARSADWVGMDMADPDSRPHAGAKAAKAA